jgi:hypothetical protein
MAVGQQSGVSVVDGIGKDVECGSDSVGDGEQHVSRAELQRARDWGGWGDGSGESPDAWRGDGNDGADGDGDREGASDGERARGGK